jgi:hypothetical protein
VRPLFVEDAPKVVEGLLLSAKVGARRMGGFALERSVHSFVTAVLLRLSRLDELRPDAELNPPRGELAKASERDIRSERLTVVGADAVRQPIGLKEPAETGRGKLEPGTGQRPAVQQVTAVGVLHRERIAKGAILKRRNWPLKSAVQSALGRSASNGGREG